MKRILSIFVVLAVYPAVTQGQLNTHENTSVKVTEGTTLSVIANGRYGSRAYAGFLEAYNKVNPSRLQIGMAIETPDLSEALRNCGVHAVASSEAEAVASLVADFRAIEMEILSNRFSNDGAEVYQPLQEGLLKRMSKLSSRVTALREVVADSKTFSDERKKVIVSKLDGAAEAMRNISAISSDGYALDIERVHRRFDSVLQGLVATGRDGARQKAKGERDPVEQPVAAGELK